MSKEQRAKERIIRARTHLLLDQPWFGTQALHLKVKPSDKFPVAATDGTNLFYNPEWVGTVSEPFLMFMFAHEVMHCALGHPWRRGDRDKEEWNHATDYVINGHLVQAGFPLVPGALHDPQFYGWSAEAVYAYRRSQQQQQKEQQKQAGNGAGADGQGQDDQTGQTPSADAKPTAGGQQDDKTLSQDSPGAATQGSAQGKGQAESGDAAGTAQQATGEVGGPGGSVGTPCPTGELLDAPQPKQNGEPEEEMMSETEWRIAAEQALRVARKAGKLPGHLETAMENQVRAATVDWVAMLREFLERLTPVNYSWRSPNRRAAAGGVTLPGFTRDELGTIAVVLDTSGSVDDTMFRTFMNEVDSILSEARPTKTLLIQCDAAVHSVDEYQPGDPFTLVRRGRGGTRFQPAFDRLEQDGEEPVALLYFTDLENYDTLQEPAYPVLWVTPNWVQEDGKFGRTVRMEG